MRLRIALALISVGAFASSCASGGDFSLDVGKPNSQGLAPFDHTHALWTALLSQSVTPEGTDYARIAKERQAFDRYLVGLQGVTTAELGTWTREQKFAFWINAYNAYTVRLIVENYPVASIKDLGDKPFGSVFDKPFVPLHALHPSGRATLLSLNDIEHGILRKQFTDARVHAAINCASRSCPPLLDEAFVADRLEDQLDSVMRRFVNDPRRNRLNRRTNTLRLSKIFDWFKSDFVRDAGGVPGYVARFADPTSAGGDTAWIAGARLQSEPYSWQLNDTKRR